MTIAEWLEQRAINDGYVGHPDYLRKYYTPRQRYFWLVVYGLTGLVPFNIGQCLRHPVQTLRTICISRRNRLVRWWKRRGL